MFCDKNQPEAQNLVRISHNLNLSLLLLPVESVDDTAELLLTQRGSKSMFDTSYFNV